MSALHGYQVDRANLLPFPSYEQDSSGKWHRSWQLEFSENLGDRKSLQELIDKNFTFELQMSITVTEVSNYSCSVNVVSALHAANDEILAATSKLFSLIESEVGQITAIQGVERNRWRNFFGSGY